MVNFEQWKCSCGNLNYIGRASCKKCRAFAPAEIVEKRRNEAPTPADEEDMLIRKTLRGIAGTEEVHRVDFFRKMEWAPDVESTTTSDTTQGSVVKQEISSQLERVSPSGATSLAEILQENNQRSIVANSNAGNLQRSAVVDSNPESPEDNDLQMEQALNAQDAQLIAEELASLEGNQESSSLLKPKADDVAKSSRMTPARPEKSKGIMHLIKAHRLHDTRVRPGELIVCEICESSFECRWQPLITSRYNHAKVHDYRLVLTNEAHEIQKIVLTHERSYTFIGLDAGKKYSVTCTARARIMTQEEPIETWNFFYIPDTTKHATVTLLPLARNCELAYYFDGQLNSYFARRPWKLYLGTVQEADGSIVQESKLGTMVSSVRFGVRGSAEEPINAKTGVSALELFAPYTLGAGVWTEFDVEGGRRSRYLIEVWVFQLPPLKEDCYYAPDQIKALAWSAETGEAPPQGECPELTVGGAFLHLRDRATGNGWVSSTGAKLIGQWERLFVITEFVSPQMKAFVQASRAQMAGSVLLDSFAVHYLGPSEIETKVKELNEMDSALSTPQFFQLSINCIEDPLNSGDRAYRFPLAVHVFWNGNFVGQCTEEEGMMEKSDKFLKNSSFRLPFRLVTFSSGVIIRVRSALTQRLIGELSIPAGSLPGVAAGSHLMKITKTVRTYNSHCPNCNCCPPFRGRLGARRVSQAPAQPRAKPESAPTRVDFDDDFGLEGFSEEDPEDPDMAFGESPGAAQGQPEPPRAVRGRLRLSVARVENDLPGANEQLISFRDGLLNREKKVMRLFLRFLKVPRSEVDELELKRSLLCFGLIDACVVLLDDGALGAMSAEVLIHWLSVSEEVMLTIGGSALKKRVRDVVHSLGAARAVFNFARAAARAADYDEQKLKAPLLSTEHLRFMNALYVQNRALLLSTVCEEPLLLELIVRCIATGGEAGRLAEVLLQEIGLGQDLPPPVLEEYWRLRRMIPLDEKFWQCPALLSLPNTFPPMILRVFEIDRLRSMPPVAPPKTPTEVATELFKSALFWGFVTLGFCTIALALYGLAMRKTGFCSLNMPFLSLSTVSMISLCYMHVLRKMIKLGVGTQVAILCCPFVTCVAVAFVGSFVWAVLQTLFLSNDTASCNSLFLQLTQLLLLSFVLGIAWAIGHTLRARIYHLLALISQHLTCFSLIEFCREISRSTRRKSSSRSEATN